MLEFPPHGNGRLIEPPGVYVDGYLGFLYLDKPDEIELYQRAWTNVWDTALSARQSIDFIKQRLNELPRPDLINAVYATGHDLGRYEGESATRLPIAVHGLPSV